MDSRLWYMASPYSKYSGGIESAFVEASRQAAFLKNHGIDVFAPIPHSHPIAIHGGLDAYDYDLMLGWDKKFIDRCDGIIVCMMDGWQDSHGVQWEIEKFTQQQKPIIYMTPGEVPNIAN
jgi:nucleoside 2-deoxyribosyltransferase